MTRRQLLAATDSAAWLARPSQAATAFSLHMRAARESNQLGLSRLETSRPTATAEARKSFRKKLEVQDD